MQIRLIVKLLQSVMLKSYKLGNFFPNFDPKDEIDC